MSFCSVFYTSDYRIYDRGSCTDYLRIEKLPKVFSVNIVATFVSFTIRNCSTCNFQKFSLTILLMIKGLLLWFYAFISFCVMYSVEIIYRSNLALDLCTCEGYLHFLQSKGQQNFGKQIKNNFACCTLAFNSKTNTPMSLLVLWNYIRNKQTLDFSIIKQNFWYHVLCNIKIPKSLPQYSIGQQHYNWQSISVYFGCF